MKLFIDLDGVLVDFDRGVYEVTGKWPHELPVGKMWGAAARTPDFFAKLNWMPDGQALWNFVKNYNPTILTGLPMGKWAPAQKRAWCGKHLGWDVEVITCMTSEKPNYSDNNHVLVDDRIKTKAGWESKGGVFITHTSATTSIQQLKALGL